MTTTVEPKKFYDLPPSDSGDRKPEHIPLAEGWDWYQFSDGMYSTRWVTNGTIFRCTNCGKEFGSRFSVRTHNGKRGIHK